MADQYGIFGANADIREYENSDIRYISADMLNIIFGMLLSTKICNGGRISYKLYYKH